MKTYTVKSYDKESKDLVIKYNEEKNGEVIAVGVVKVLDMVTRPVITYYVKVMEMTGKVYDHLARAN